MQPKTVDHRYSNVLKPTLNRIELTIPPNNRIVIRTKSQRYPKNSVTDKLQPSYLLHKESDNIVYRALVTLNDGVMQESINSFLDHTYKLQKGLHVSKFPSWRGNRKYVKPVERTSTWHLL